MSATVRALLEIVTASDGVPNIDYRVGFQRGAMSTGFRFDTDKEPEPFMRSRLIPGTTRHLNQFFAYKRDSSPTDVLHALKNHANSPAVRQFVRRAAVYLARAVNNYYTPDAVIYAPSSVGLSQQLATELAARLGDIPVLAPPEKLKKMSKIGVAQRMQTAKQNFRTTDQPRLNGVILVVDDFTTSGSTLVGIAANLLDNPDVTDVVAAALAIH